MSEQKRFTPQEMREMAECAEKGENCYDLSAMLRQAADAEEENAKLREENAKLTNIISTECNTCGDCAKFGNDCAAGDVDGNEDCRACEKFVPREVTELKARLEAVVKECEKGKWKDHKTIIIGVFHNEVIDAILRAARGEGGAE